MQMRFGPFGLSILGNCIWQSLQEDGPPWLVFRQQLLIHQWMELCLLAEVRVADSKLKGGKVAVLRIGGISASGL